METFERELMVARISSGTVRCPIRDFHDKPATIIIKQPTRDQIYIGQELYVDVFRESELGGLFTDDEIYDFMMEGGFWDDEKEKNLKAIPKDIDEFKFKLFKLTFKTNERNMARKAIDKARSLLNELLIERNAYSYLSCSGAANLARSKYLLGCSLYYPNGQPVFTSETFWEEPSDLLDRVSLSYSQIRLDEVSIRELARTEPWRTTWICRKGEGSVFGRPPIDYTEEQRSLVGWSNLYDNIFEHPDCPSEEIVEDDDILDGWLIDQRRQREARQTKKSAEELIGNEKVRGSQEIFLVADTIKDAGKINELNDEHVKHVLRQRFAHIKKHGIVAEQDMPDTKRDIAMQQVQASMKGPV